MAKRDVYHVTKNKGDGWKVKKEGAQRASGNFPTKKEAVSRGRGLAKNVSLGQLKIHKKGGQFQAEHTYGKDPYPPKG